MNHKTRANENYRAHDWDMFTEMTTDIPDSPPGYADSAMSLSKRTHLAPTNRRAAGQDWD